MLISAGDDSSIETEPTRHVDYLSHDWREQDAWSSWRYVANRKHTYENGPRLENAVWRSWAKLRFSLGTVRPESLNWFKDVDVTWLYGPLQTDQSSVALPTPSSNSTSTSSFLDKKPILKKRTISQSFLQHSRYSNAPRRAEDSALETSMLGRASSHSSVDGRRYPPMDNATSNAHSLSDRRHISFNNEVAQCVAIDAVDQCDGHDRIRETDRLGYYNYQDDDFSILGDEEPSDDEILVMKGYPFEPSISSQTTPRSSFSSDSRTIAHLPSTTLKYRSDTPEPPDGLDEEDPYHRFCSSLSRSSSTETLRPVNNSSHSDSNTKDAYGRDLEPEPHSSREPFQDTSTISSFPVEGDWFRGSGMHPNRFSGVFTPFGYGDRAESDESGNPNGSPTANRGILDKLVDTANTAKDIAYVIWNVGWGG